MKTRTILLGVLGLAGPALAAPPDVAILTQATTVLNECAAIAREIDAMKIPPGHANANMRAATLKAAGLTVMPSAATVQAATPTPTSARGSGGGPIDSSRAGAADAEAAAKAQAAQAKAAADAQVQAQADAAAKEQAMQDAFEVTIKAQVDRFAACGKTYADVVPKANARLTELSNLNPADADAKAVTPTVDAYVKATQAFSSSATRLSRDRYMQSYVAQTLTTYYFK